VFTALLVHSPEGMQWWQELDHEPAAVVEFGSLGSLDEVPLVPPVVSSRVTRPRPPANAKVRLDADDIESAATTTRALTERCWAMSLKHRPLNALEVHRVVATLAIETDGSVSKIDLVGVPDGDDGGLRSCLTTVVGGWRMPATKAAASYDVTLAFQ
jgi:hypothetical protein